LENLRPTQNHSNQNTTTKEKKNGLSCRGELGTDARRSLVCFSHNAAELKCTRRTLEKKKKKETDISNLCCNVDCFGLSHTNQVINQKQQTYYYLRGNDFNRGSEENTTTDYNEIQNKEKTTCLPTKHEYLPKFSANQRSLQYHNWFTNFQVPIPQRMPKPKSII
jgi:hypothetical protein